MPFSIPPVLKVGDFELSLFDQTFQYYFIMAIVGLGFYLMWRVLQSPLGRAFVAVRENDMRASLIGPSPYKVRYISFVLSGFLASLAGVLFCLFARYATAQYLFWTVSGEGVVWMIVGGAGTLFGPAIGTALLIVLREELSVYWEHYLLIVGVIVILVVTFAPQGIMGLINDWVAGREARKRASENNAPRRARQFRRRAARSNRPDQRTPELRCMGWMRPCQGPRGPITSALSRPMTRSAGSDRGRIGR